MEESDKKHNNITESIAYVLINKCNLKYDSKAYGFYTTKKIKVKKWIFFEEEQEIKEFNLVCRIEEDVDTKKRFIGIYDDSYVDTIAKELTTMEIRKCAWL